MVLQQSEVDIDLSIEDDADSLSENYSLLDDQLGDTEVDVDDMCSVSSV